MNLNLQSLIISMMFLVSFVQAEVKVNKMFSDHMVLQRDMKVPIWGTAGAGEKVTVSIRGQSVSVTASAEGKWTVRLEPLKVGDATELTVKGTNTIVFKDVLVGEVWIGSGQSNMAGGVRGYARNDKVLAKWAGGSYPNLRLYKGSWNIAEGKVIEGFSAIHFSFGFRLQQELKVPVGLMVGAVGGTPSGRWLSPEMASADAALMKALGGSFDDIRKKYEEAMAKWAEASKKAKAEGKKVPRKPRGPIKVGDLYAKNIAYMVPYGIRGVLWDQGESRTALPNVDQFTTMNALITGWRKTWGQGDFHFLHVQKPSGGRAAFDSANPINLKAVSFDAKYPSQIISSPKALEYQLNHVRIAKIKNAPLVTACDLAPGVHPPTKSSYGHRAARVALGSVYDRDVAICGPVYKSHKVEGAKVRISFDHVGNGLTFKHADTVRGFAIAGSDGKWAWAEAKIDGDTIVLSSETVAAPTQIQYALNRRNNFANLYNKDGLPALMFITGTK